MIKRLPLALEALVDQALYIAEDSPTQAERLMEMVEATLRTLESSPGIGQVYESGNPRLEGLRSFRVNGFQNHLIFYKEVQGGIVFVHLLHAARDIPSVLELDL
jgi:toxin ParE1/3/4